MPILCQDCELERATDTLITEGEEIQLCDECYWTKYHKEEDI